MFNNNDEFRCIPGVSKAITVSRDGRVQWDDVDVENHNGVITALDGDIMSVQSAVRKAFPGVTIDPDTNPQAFMYKARALAADAINKDFPIDTHAKAAITEDMYVVWFAKVLGNWKALVSTDILYGRYFEITYDGNKNQTYVDDYRKASNTCVTDTEYASAHLSRHRVRQRPSVLNVGTVSSKTV